MIELFCFALAVLASPFKSSEDVSILTPVCTENLIRVDDVMESPKLAE